MEPTIHAVVSVSFPIEMLFLITSSKLLAYKDTNKQLFKILQLPSKLLFLYKFNFKLIKQIFLIHALSYNILLIFIH